MGYLVLPRSIADERDEINADRRAQVFSDYAEHWTAEVKRVDPSLEIVRAHEQSTDPDLIPGHWYLLKHIPGSVDEFMELPKPPGGWLYDWLTGNDLWNPRVHRSKQEAKEKIRAAKVRARQLEASQRQDEMALAYRAARRIRDDRGMTHSSAAKRRGDGIK